MLPFDSNSGESSTASAPPVSSVTATKRKLEDDSEDADEAPAKRHRPEQGVQDRIERPLSVLGQRLANVAKNPLSWSSPRTSVWSLLGKIPGLGIRVDAHQYGLNKRMEAEKEQVSSRKELERMMKEVTDHACPPCENCEECWLF